MFVIIKFDPATAALITRALDYLESSQNAGVQAVIDKAASDLKQSNSTIETDLSKEN